MKKSELKSIIKECVKEILFEEGVLSNLVAEVAFGISKAQNQLLENSEKQRNISALQKKDNQEHLQRLTEEAAEEKRRSLLETKRKMINAMANSKMKGAFEGTTPLSNTSVSSSPQSPLAGIDPTDAGVDISGIFGLAGEKWKQLK